MRCLLVSEIFPPQHGGSGRWFWEIYRRLSLHDVAIIAGEHPQQATFDAEHALTIERVNLHMTQWGLRSRAGLLGYWRAARAVARLARGLRPCVVHSGRVLPEGWIALLLKLRYGLPYLCFVHGEDIHTAKMSRELTWMCRRVLGGAATIIANSRNSCRLLTDEWQVPQHKVHILHPGADTTYFVPKPVDDGRRVALGWDGRTVLLTVGRLQQRKGQDMLIRALGAIRQKIPNVLYSIVGEGAERHALERLAEELGVRDAVEFRGEPNDAELRQCYQQCDLFILPNRQLGNDIEGFGMVLVEAQACGKAVVAGESGGTAETMRIGETGLIVDCTRPEPLAQAVTELLSDVPRRLAMGCAARRWAVEQFDWEPLAKQAAAIFASA